MKHSSFKLKMLTIISTLKDAPIIRSFTFLFLIIGVIGCSLIAGCMDVQTAPTLPSPLPADDTLTIACTIPPQEEFIRAITGDEATILIMVPPGSSPHTFEPTPSQITGLESSDMYVAVGSGLEFENRWLQRIREMYPDLIIINSSENILLRSLNDQHEHDEHETSEQSLETGTDPHVWLSVRNAAEMVNTTTKALMDLRPDQAGAYSQNRDTYLSLLNDLDTKIKTKLSPLPSRKILVYHPAYGYFCQDYDLTQIAVETDGKEPAARTLARLIDEAIAENITLVFAEPEHSTRGAETLALEINATLVLITPLSGNYLENMQHIADNISGI
jgi:zinc transport system substrate-binding protein